MRYERARQRKSDGRWDYTVSWSNGEVVIPIGYCREFDMQEFRRSLTDQGLPLEQILNEVDKVGAFLHKYHTDGHVTESEACRCYTEYQLDHSLRFVLVTKLPHQVRECKECGVATPHFAQIEDHYVPLCEQHHTRVVVEKHFKVGWSFGC